MIGRMALTYGDECSATRVANFPVRDQFRLDCRPILRRFNDMGFQRDKGVRRGWPQELDMKVSGYGTRSLGSSVAFHEEVRGGPIRMAVE